MHDRLTFSVDSDQEDSTRARRLITTLAAWGSVGVVVGLFYAYVAVHWNDTMRVPQTALVLSIFLAAGFALISSVLGLSLLTVRATFRRLATLTPRAKRERSYWVGGEPLASQVLVAFGVWAVLVAGMWLLDGPAKMLPMLQKQLIVTASLLLAGTIAWALLAFVPRTFEKAVGLRLSLTIVGVAATAWALAIGSESRIWSSTPEPFVDQELYRQARSDQRVFLIGLDGADWRKIDALVDQGRLPAFEALIRDGARANLRTSIPTFSPIVWTSIATGMNETSHGIRDFVEFKLPGSRAPAQGLEHPRLLPLPMRLVVRWLVKHDYLESAPVSSFHRRVKAVWEILSEGGWRVGVINWYATWPSEKVNGFFITDNNPWRAAFQEIKHGSRNPQGFGTTYPPGLIDQLIGSDLQDLGDASGVTFESNILADIDESTKGKLAKREILRTIYETDTFSVQSMRRLLEWEPLDFVGIYLSGIDNFSHRLARLPDVIDRYYIYVDGLLGQLKEKADENTTIIIVSDHGWEYERRSLGHDHGPDGILLLAGSGIRSGVELEQSPSVFDITPTILALFGLPTSAEMDGRPISAAFTDGSIGIESPHTARSYGPRNRDLLLAATERDSESNEEALEKLRALGYLR